MFETPDYMLDELFNNPADPEAFSDPSRLLSRLGNANWRAFQALKVGHPQQLNFDIKDVIEDWKIQIGWIEKPWLVWSVDEDWAYVQQQLVESVGWIPIVGYDPRKGVPTKLTSNAILVDFNRVMKLPILYMHFPLDYIHEFLPRLAFWHSDLLVRPEKMTHVADVFANLSDNEIAMCNLTKIKNPILRALTGNGLNLKLFELVGCINAKASLDIQSKGLSMWQGWYYHPLCPSEEEFKKRQKWHYDHGTGLLYWMKKYGGKVKIIQESYLDEGHFSRTSKDSFKVVSPNNEGRDTGVDLKVNYDVYALAEQMNIPVTK